MAEQDKERFISFRVSEEEYALIEEIAWKGGKKPNEWSRKLVLSEAAKGNAMTGIERLLYEEIARVRYLLGNGFSLMSVGKLTGDEWQRRVDEADKNRGAIAQSLFNRRHTNGSSSG
ncbi:MAG: hypothetical protein MOB07_14055 [Acidobacteria bacterium]|nr:hypothetical protein [Acidobacteriota bacterium]